MNVLIYESQYIGHYHAYVRYLVSALLELGIKPTVAIGSGHEKTTQYAVNLGPLQDRISVHPIIPAIEGQSPYRRLVRAVRALGHTIRALRPDHLLVPSAEGLVYGGSLLRVLASVGPSCRGAMEAGLIWSKYHLAGQTWPRRLRSELLIQAMQHGPWDRIATIDFLAHEHIQKRGGPLAQKFSLVPDPLDETPLMERDAARNLLKLPDQGRYLGAAGVFGSRNKGTLQLIEAFSRADLDRHDRLLLVGPLTDELRERINSNYRTLRAQDRLITLDRYVEIPELMAGLAAMDLVCTPYPGHHWPSGIVTRATAMMRPVLVSDIGWFREYVRRFKVGWTLQSLDLDSMARALPRYLEAAQGFQMHEAGARIRRYTTAKNYGALWTERIRQRLGLEPDRSIVSWDWVMQAAHTGD